MLISLCFQENSAIRIYLNVMGFAGMILLILFFDIVNDIIFIDGISGKISIAAT